MPGELAAGGWREVRMESLGAGLYLPPDWYVALPPHPGLDEFAAIPENTEAWLVATSAPLEVDEDMAGMAIYAQGAAFAEGGSETTILYIHEWTGAVGTAEWMAHYLADNHQVRWIDITEMATGVGDIAGIHYWSTSESANVFSAIEYVFEPPTGGIHVLTMVAIDRIAKDMWPIYQRVAASLHRLDRSS